MVVHPVVSKILKKCILELIGCLVPVPSEVGTGDSFIRQRARYQCPARPGLMSINIGLSSMSFFAPVPSESGTGASYRDSSLEPRGQCPTRLGLTADPHHQRSLEESSSTHGRSNNTVPGGQCRDYTGARKMIKFNDKLYND